MDISFYHISGETPATADTALPALLSKILSTGQKVAVICPTPERLHRLDETLWTYQKTSFLPHIPFEDIVADSKEVQSAHPITLLTAEEVAASSENLSNRLPLLLAGTEKAQALLSKSTEKALYLFQNHPDVLPTARSFFGTLKKEGHNLTYWQQDDKTGRWGKKA
ncbi:MAG: DNA polymerase III subunit chi [Alphaproteobacteria bacterium CG_4_10_14_0_8_um_filter_53_9]|nr:MAG: DNA polymerase III subunit chi [Alphaproteobacteria bacterium CG_4_10_14_0_8_um_filter_53_9]